MRVGRERGSGGGELPTSGIHGGYFWLQRGGGCLPLDQILWCTPSVYSMFHLDEVRHSLTTHSTKHEWHRNWELSKIEPTNAKIILLNNVNKSSRLTLIISNKVFSAANAINTCLKCLLDLPAEQRTYY